MLKRAIGSLLNKLLKIFGYKIIKIKHEAYINTMMSQLDRYGHFRSYIENTSIDKAGNPIPWFTYPAIEYINQLDLSHSELLEWGSGASSEYFQSKVKKITSIEHDKAWYQRMKSLFIDGNEIIFADENDYIDVAYNLRKKFDLIVVDGIQRDKCILAAKDLIKDDGIIILDNSDRHPDLCKLMRELDYIQIDMHGIGPINKYGWTTTLFYNRSSAPVPISRQPQIPIGGGY